MRLLLTSAGITNQKIASALIKLVGRNEEIKVGFIPTAANVEVGEKGWFIDQLKNLQNYGFTWIDIVDISAPQVDWKSRLEGVDVIFVSGGNTFHLLDQVRKTGFDKWLKSNLENKVYVGVSAGSILTTPSIAVCTIAPSDENLPGIQDLGGLNLVNFEVEPHCDEIRFKTMEEYSKTTKGKLYALDDKSAVSISDSEVEVISEGEWRLYNS